MQAYPALATKVSFDSTLSNIWPKSRTRKELTHNPNVEMFHPWSRTARIVNDDPTNKFLIEFMSTTGAHLRIANEEKVAVGLCVDSCNLVCAIVDFDPGSSAGFADLCIRIRVLVSAYSHDWKNVISF
jgi:hypothetical protein